MAKKHTEKTYFKTLRNILFIATLSFQNQALALTCDELLFHIAKISRSHYLYSDPKFYNETPNIADDKIVNFIVRTLDRAANVWVLKQNKSLHSRLTLTEELQARKAFDALKSENCEAAFDLTPIKLKALERFEKNFKEAVSAITAVKSDNSLPYYFVKKKDTSSAKDEVQLKAETALYLNSLFANNSNETLNPIEKIKLNSQSVARDILDIKLKAPTDIFEEVLDSYAAALDPHSEHLNDYELREFSENIFGNFKSIGLTVEHTEQYPTVEAVLKDQENLNVDIKVKDEIVGISQDGVLFENTNTLTSQQFEDKMRGAPDTVVYLKLRRAGATSLITAKRTRKTYAEKNPQALLVESFETLDSSGQSRKVGVIRFFTFYSEIANDVKAALKKLSDSKVDAIVIDIRSNFGGSLDETAEIMDALIAEGSSVQAKYNSKRIDQYTRARDPEYKRNNPEIANAETLYAGPLVVAINNNSASASEILAGALKDYKRALIVGSKQSFGKGSVQTVQMKIEDTLYNRINNLQPNGIVGALKFTVAAFFLPSGKSTQFDGAQSDIVIPSPRNDLLNRGGSGEHGYHYTLELDDIASVVNMESAQGSNPWKILTEEQLQTLKQFSSERLSKDKDAQLIAEYNERVDSLLKKETLTVGEYEEVSAWKQKHLSQQEIDVREDTRPSSERLKYNPKTNLMDREILALTADYVSVLNAPATSMLSNVKP